jgi:Protein of unknown function (DUF4197)
MPRKLSAILLPVALLAGCSAASLLGEVGGGKQELSLQTIVAGLKEALKVGTRNAVKTTSKTDGYWKSARIRIPMPPELEKMSSTLRKIGLGGKVDEFEKKMNQSAERAAALATPIFIDAIKSMTFNDARNILKGSKTEATDYFRGKTTAPLARVYAPIVRSQMEKVGAVKEYNRLLKRYNAIPLVPKPKFDLDEYVTRKALQGLFTVVADEERKIRERPAARTTELLRKVFGR